MAVLTFRMMFVVLLSTANVLAVTAKQPECHMDCVAVQEALLRLEARMVKLEEENENQRKENLELRQRLSLNENSGKLLTEISAKGSVINVDSAPDGWIRHGKDSTHSRVQRQELPAVAFFARKKQHTYHIAMNETIVFEDVVTNSGNAYHYHLGAFIAPVDGLYIIAATIEALAHNTLHAGIYKNDDLQATVFVNGKDNEYDRGSHTIVLILRRGDEVAVRRIFQTDGGIQGDYQSTFSGVLIKENDGSAPVGK